MSPKEFKAARLKLGLSVKDMAGLLGVSPVHVRRMELRKRLTAHRAVPKATAKLVEAWLSGYRPSGNWPKAEDEQS